MQSHRSATAVVMKEGNVILVSQRHGHPDVYLEEHEKTVLAVPIKVQPKFAGVSSSFSDLLPGAVVGCVEVRGAYSRVHAFTRSTPSDKGLNVALFQPTCSGAATRRA
jgi:hypothetical protein